MIKNLTFKNKLITVPLFFISITVLLVSWVTLYFGSIASKMSIDESLNNSQSIQKEFFTQQAKQLELISLLVSSEPAFVNYIAEAINFYEEEKSISYLTSIADLLLERKQQYSFDFAIITDPKGYQLARSDQAIIVVKDLSSSTLVVDAMSSLAPVKGFWHEDGSLFQTAIVPIARGQQLVGFLITGQIIDNNYLNAIAQLNSTDVILLRQDLSILASSTSAPKTNAFVKQLKQKNTTIDIQNENIQNELSIFQQSYVYTTTLLDKASDNNNAYLYSTISRSKILSPFIKTRLALAILAIIISILAVITTLRILNPFIKDIKKIIIQFDKTIDNKLSYQTLKLTNPDLHQLSTKLNQLNQTTKGRQYLAMHMVEISKKIPEINDYFWIGGDHETIKPNKIIGSRFKILRKLGSGGMGVVFQAIDIELNEIIALKVLHKKSSEGLKISQLKDEIKFCRRINDPNVVRIHDFGKIGGNAFISMEYIKGYTIADIIKHSIKLRPDAALYTSKQICLGLIAAHNSGIIHRDLKPENLIVDLDTTVKLMDFGIASAQSLVSKHQKNEIIEVTISYTSPEQIQGKGADERSDIYALGTIIMELFCGHLPYDEKNEEQLMIDKVSKNPISISEYWASAPIELESIINKCIAILPDSRYQSVSEVLEDLNGLIV